MRPAEHGYVYYRPLISGKYIAVLPRLYNVIVLIGDQDDHMGYDTHWCYEDVAHAVVAAKAWDPAKDKEPCGWFRHAASGRRRPDGDPAKEYVQV